MRQGGSGMKSYEVRVFDECGRSLIYHRHYTDDRSAIEAARALADEKTFDLWRGMVCIMAAQGFFDAGAVTARIPCYA